MLMATNLDCEGDREYLAPGILGGKYGLEADIFSFRMIMLECAGNIVLFVATAILQWT
jgi:hypothetical protein